MRAALFFFSSFAFCLFTFAFRVVATRRAIIGLKAANENRVGTGARSDRSSPPSVSNAQTSPPVKIREGLMKSTLIRRNLFVFALAATLAASSLAGLRTASAAAPQQKPGAAASKPAPQRGATAQTPAGPIAEAVPLVSRVLPNGLEVIVLEDHSVPLVTVEMAVRNGSFTEPPELNGLSHLYEHMFFKVSPERGKQADYLQNIDALGIVYNGQTQEEVVEYYFTTTTPNFPVAMRFMRDQAQYQSFDEGQFTQEKEVVIGELERHEANPFGEIGEQLNNKLFYKYPSRKN